MPEVLQSEQPIEICPKAFVSYEHQKTARDIHLYISDSIEEPKLYTEMIHIIKTAGPHDTIYINLNTPGGRLDTTTQIVAAIRTTQARVVTSAEGAVYSAGTIIFLSSDEFIVNDHCQLMFHNFSGGAFGKGNELKIQIDASVQAFQQMAYDIYYPFLEIEEIEDLLQGKDIWMGSDETRDRLHKMVKLIDENDGERPKPKKKTPRKKKAAAKKPVAKKAPVKKKPVPKKA